MTRNVSLPEALRDFLDEQVATGNDGTHSEYVRELIRRERDRLRLREALLQGAESEPATDADDPYFRRLRARAVDSRT
jgi:antitoxin ParD1/3/4